MRCKQTICLQQDPVKDSDGIDVCTRTWFQGEDSPKSPFLQRTNAESRDCIVHTFEPKDGQLFEWTKVLQTHPGGMLIHLASKNKQLFTQPQLLKGSKLGCECHSWVHNPSLWKLSPAHAVLVRCFAPRPTLPLWSLSLTWVYDESRRKLHHWSPASLQWPCWWSRELSGWQCTCGTVAQWHRVAYDMIYYMYTLIMNSKTMRFEMNLLKSGVSSWKQLPRNTISTHATVYPFQLVDM